MKNRGFELNEQTLSIIEEIGGHMPGGLFIYAAHEPERLVYANKAVLDIYGCADLEEFRLLTGFTFKGMVHPEDYERVSGSIIHQIETSDEQMDYIEYRIIRKDGTVRWVDDYGHFTETKAYGGVYVVFISDITEKRQHLIIGTNNIDAQMKREKEYQQRIAEAHASARNDFLANMSHDIRTPMNAIVGFTNIAKSHINDPGSVENALEKIGSSSHFLLSLINDILDISKIESGKMQLSYAPCDLGEVLQNASCHCYERQRLR